MQLKELRDNKLQLTQNTLDEINVKVAATNNFTSAQQIKFVDALKQGLEKICI